MKFRKPWVNPPFDQSLGSGRGTWRIVVPLIIVLVIAAIVILALVETGNLDRGWIYVCLPIGGVGAVLALVLTVFKAASEGKQG